MLCKVFRPAWLVVLILIIPTRAFAGFFDDLVEGVKSVVQRPPECSEPAEPLAKRQAVSVPTGVRFYKGPGTKCGYYGVTTQAIPVTLVGSSGDWYLFDATDPAGERLQAWIAKNSVTLTSQSNYQPQHKSLSKYSSYPKELIADVQQSLNAKGYKAGVVDGIYGRGTRAALMQFQRDAGLPESGEPDSDTLAILKKEDSYNTSSAVTESQDTNPKDVKLAGSNVQVKPDHNANIKTSERNANTSYKARHILVKTEEEANGIIDALNNGADFIELAKKRSTGPSSTQGGDLGWFASAQMVKPFSDATAKLEKGSYTRTPVKTQFGWHVILLEDVRLEKQVAAKKSDLPGTHSGDLESASKSLSDAGINPGSLIVKPIGCGGNSRDKVNTVNVFVDKAAPIWDEKIASSVLSYGALYSKSTCQHIADSVVMIIADKEHKDRDIYSAFPQAIVVAKYDMRGNPARKSYTNKATNEHAANIEKAEREQEVLEDGFVMKNVHCNIHWSYTDIYVGSDVEFLDDKYIKSLLYRGIDHGKKACKMAGRQKAIIYSKTQKEDPNRSTNEWAALTIERGAERDFHNAEGVRRKERLATETKRNQLLELIKNNNVEEYVEVKELVANPFIYEDKVIVTKAYFSNMLSRDEALFGYDIGLVGLSYPFIATKVPTTRFKDAKKILLVGRVKGNMRYEMPSGDKVLVANIEFIDAYEEKYKSSDFDWVLKEIFKK